MDLPGNELPPEQDRQAAKTRWRTHLLNRRAEMSADVHTAEARALASAVRTLPLGERGATVCAYLPFGSEPGSADLIDELAAAGPRVLLPVVPRTRGPLEWSPYNGRSSLAAGQIKGLLEPTGPMLGPSAIAEAALILVPALAVDHSGVRLGRGAGYYDRSLPLATPGTELVAVVRDEELVPELPAEPHDERVTGAVTPGKGFVRLPLPRTPQV